MKCKLLSVAVLCAVLMGPGAVSARNNAEGDQKDKNPNGGPQLILVQDGTNVHNMDFVRGQNPDALANALGTSAVVVTADGYLALGRRSSRVANHPGYLHCFGGMLETAVLTHKLIEHSLTAVAVRGMAQIMSQSHCFCQVFVY